MGQRIIKHQRRHLVAALRGADQFNSTLAIDLMQSAVIGLQRSGEITPEEAAKALRFDMPTYWIACSTLDKRARDLIQRANEAAS